ncbi:MAG TPA: DUF1572 family protein [Thermoanaerobaculia bacterium]|nr:DUF1572 family protein [Thermoanaerobaculia bacterium]
MNEKALIELFVSEFEKLKKQADRAAAQVEDDDFSRLLDPEANSIASLMKHLAGNMHSRWTDFLTTDGEKATRERDEEFELRAGDTREEIVAAWEDGWQRALEAISVLTPADLAKTITIRGEPHLVPQAILRQLTHYAAHVGQIVMLAKHWAGSEWKTLSIPRGKSKEFEVSKRGEAYETKS